MATTADYHPVTEQEQSQALALWYQVFDHCKPGYFERYFSSASPLYRYGDTLGAWCDGRLVSAVHICRLTLRNGNDTFLCGGIANVATLPEYRERGLSRHLLQKAIDKMIMEGFHISILNSRRNSHYVAVGFEQFSLSMRPLIDLKKDNDEASSSSSFDWKAAKADDEVFKIYAEQPRPLQLDRPWPFFEGWINWNWEHKGETMLHVIPGKGYIVLTKEKGQDYYSASEWRANECEIEKILLLGAVRERHRFGLNHMRLATIPVFVGQEWIEQNLGRIVQIEQDGTTMIRNISLPTHLFDKIKQHYWTGEAVVWPADFF